MHYKSNKNIFVEQYKTIYFFLQKNGCSTLKAQMVELLDMPKTTNFPKDVHDPKFYPYPRVKKGDINTVYKDYLRFSVVRNPWERLVSCYKDKVMNHSADYNFFSNCSTEIYGGMSFEAFVDVVITIPDRIADHHFSGQLYHLVDTLGEFYVNYICNLEKLNEHIKELSKIYNIPFSELPKLNSVKKSSKSSYEDLYTPELIEKVRKRFIADVDFFKFEFGKKNETFPFGFVDENLQTALAEPTLLTPILKEKIRHMRKEMDWLYERSNQLKEVTNSTSWKVAAPIRKIKKIFSGF